MDTTEYAPYSVVIYLLFLGYNYKLTTLGQTEEYYRLTGVGFMQVPVISDGKSFFLELDTISSITIDANRDFILRPIVESQIARSVRSLKEMVEAVEGSKQGALARINQNIIINMECVVDYDWTNHIVHFSELGGVSSHQVSRDNQAKVIRYLRYKIR